MADLLFCGRNLFNGADARPPCGPGRERELTESCGCSVRPYLPKRLGSTSITCRGRLRI